MGYIADFTEHYFSTTSPEQQKRDWEELKKYNQGPNILDVINNYGRGTQHIIPFDEWSDDNVISSSDMIDSSFNDTDLFLAA